MQRDRMPLTLSIASASTQVEERKGIPLILPSTSVDHDSKSMMSLLQRQQETASQKGSSSEEIDCADPNSIEQNGEPYDDRIQCSPDDELDGFGELQYSLTQMRDLWKIVNLLNRYEFTVDEGVDLFQQVLVVRNMFVLTLKRLYGNHLFFIRAVNISGQQLHLICVDRVNDLQQ